MQHLQSLGELRAEAKSLDAGVSPFWTPQPLRVMLYSLFSSEGCRNAKYTKLLAVCTGLQNNMLALCFRLASITCLLSGWRSKYII